MTRRSLCRSLAGLAVAGLVIVAGCSVNPATGKRELNFVSTSQEISMGRESDPAILAEYGAYADTSLASFVNTVGRKLAAVSERPELDWHFRVLDTKVVNAFAVPGGYIYVTRGIMAAMNSEAQLAGILGHEIGHVTARHTARQITKAQLASMGLLAGSLLSSDIARYSDVAQQGLSVLFLKFSRDDETQADELGIRYCVKAGYDPREVPATYDMLNRMAQQEGGSLPTWMSTHPDPGNRKVRTSTLAHEAVLLRGEAGLVVNEESYKKRLVGLVYGDDPRSGYLVDNHFYHPDMGFEMLWPNGWKVQNSAASVVSQSPDGKAAIQLTIENTGDGPEDPAAYVDYLLKKGEIAQAAGQARTINGKAAWVGRIATSGAAQTGGSTAESGSNVLSLAFIKGDSKTLYQFLGAPGRTDADGRFLNTVESFGPIRDAAAAQVKPNRVETVAAPGDKTMQTLASTQKNLACPIEEISWLNNYFVNDTPARGKLLKMVRRYQ